MMAFQYKPSLNQVAFMSNSYIYNPKETQPGYGYIADDTASVEDTYFYHSDHLGSTSYVTDGKANVTQYEAYLPYGELLVDEHNNSEEMPYKFNGKEMDEETGLYYYGARYMNPQASIWYGVDPLAEKYPGIGGYVYCHENPIKYIDPKGENMTEYDVNGKKISNLGGNQIDFYHQMHGDVKIINRTNKQTNIIYKGSEYIRNYTHRDLSVSWSDIAQEFKDENGPTYSLFSDFSNQEKGVFRSLENYKSVYGLAARSDVLKNSQFKKKGVKNVTTIYANPMTAGLDMWEQMIGEARVCWYDLGDKVLFMMLDSKSNKSLFYHLPFIHNKLRGEKGFGYGDTHQTYIWTETKNSIRMKNDAYFKYLQMQIKMFKRPY